MFCCGLFLIWNHIDLKWDSWQSHCTFFLVTFEYPSESWILIGSVSLKKIRSAQIMTSLFCLLGCNVSESHLWFLDFLYTFFNLSLFSRTIIYSTSYSLFSVLQMSLFRDLSEYGLWNCYCILSPFFFSSLFFIGSVVPVLNQTCWNTSVSVHAHRTGF